MCSKAWRFQPGSIRWSLRAQRTAAKAISEGRNSALNLFDFMAHSVIAKMSARTYNNVASLLSESFE
jgi:hypothetical protein